MKTILIAIVVLALTFLGGGLAGWLYKGYSVAQADVVAAHAGSAAITASVDKQAAAQSAKAAEQLAQSGALAAEQSLFHQQGNALHLEITHAFTFSPAPAGSCADPIGTDEFVGLYDKAASGGTPNPAPAGPTQ